MHKKSSIIIISHNLGRSNEQIYKNNTEGFSTIIIIVIVDILTYVYHSSNCALVSLRIYRRESRRDLFKDRRADTKVLCKLGRC